MMNQIIILDSREQHSLYDSPQADIFTLAKNQNFWKSKANKRQKYKCCAWKGFGVAKNKHTKKHPNPLFWS